MKEERKGKGKVRGVDAERNALRMAKEFVDNYKRDDPERKEKVKKLRQEPRKIVANARRAGENSDYARKHRIVVHVNEANQDVMQERIEKLNSRVDLILVKQSVFTGNEHSVSQATYVYEPKREN